LVTTAAPFEKLIKGELVDHKTAPAVVLYRYMTAARLKSGLVVYGFCTAPADATREERRQPKYFVAVDPKRLGQLVTKDVRTKAVTKEGPLTLTWLHDLAAWDMADDQQRFPQWQLP